MSYLDYITPKKGPAQPVHNKTAEQYHDESLSDSRNVDTSVGGRARNGDHERMVSQKSWNPRYARKKIDTFAIMKDGAEGSST